MEEYEKLNYVASFSEGKVNDINDIHDPEHVFYQFIFQAAESRIELMEDYDEDDGSGIPKQLYGRGLLLGLVRELSELFSDFDIMASVVTDPEVSDKLYYPMLEILAIIGVYKK